MNRQQLRKEMFDLETVNPELKEQFQKQIQSIVDKTLKPWERILALILMPVAAGLSLFCGRLWLLAAPVYSSLVRAEAGIVSLIGALLVAWAILVVKKNRHLTNGLVIPTVAFGFFVAMIVVSIAMTGSVELDLIAATMLVGFVCIWERIKIAELRIRENLLRQELRLAQFTENMGRVDAGDDCQ